MFQKIKDYFLNKHLVNNKIDRKPCLVSLPHARSIGLICEITNEDSYKSIFHVFARLQESGRNVRLIGYVNDKEVPFYCLPQLTADYFCNKHLNWYGLPNMVQLNDFVKMDFDMVIDFNYRYNSPVKALLSLTRARFIIGRMSECASLYDLYLDCANCDNLKYLEAIHNYTQKLSGYER